jgi:hypothetical protein
MPTDNDPNVQIESGGITFMVATDTVLFYGATAHFQYMKLAYGPTGSASIVSASNGLPVNVIAGGITANLVGFCGAVQGIPGGTPVEVSGTVYATGISSAPVFVRTFTGSQVEVTGGRNLSRVTDSVSVWGPGGLTYVYTNIVGASMNSVGVSGDALKVAIIGAGFTASVTLSSIVGVTNDGATNGLRIQGMSGGTSVATTVGNTLNVNENNIINGVTALYSKLNDLYSAISSFGVIRPSGIVTGLVSNVTTSMLQLSVTGYTCTNGVNIKASSSNTDLIYVGNTGVGTNLGYILDPGDEFLLNIDNLNKIYVRSKSGTQVLSYLAT